MYNNYFGFSEAPFSIAPDPRYLFMSDRHREALAHLLYGLRIDGGFVLLTGEVGTGKTTVSRCLLEQIPQNCDVAFIVNPRLNTIEMLATLCEELHIGLASNRLSVKVFVDLINFHLLESNARGRKTVLIIDEAQNLSGRALEQLRLLTNLETNQRKLLQIILIGQPELRKRLAEPDMRPLAQRIVARYHLEPLSRREVGAYIDYRLAVGGVRYPLFPDAVVDQVYRLSRGTPRLINVICDRALLGAYVEGKPILDRKTLAKAAKEVLGSEAMVDPRRAPRGSSMRWLAASVIGMALVAALAAGYQRIAAIAPRPADPRSARADSSSSVVAPAAKLELKSAAKPAEPPAFKPANAVVPDRTAIVSAEPIAWPGDKDPVAIEAFAVRALFKLWNVDLASAGITEACAQAPQRSVQCLQSSGEVKDLVLMNVPAILSLRTDSGKEILATLTALNDRRAALLIAGEAREITLDALRRQWSGRYTVAWRGPAVDSERLALGASGPEVSWVAQQLARLAGQAPPPETKRFDAALRQKVLDFQRARGLDADGVVGRLTMVRIAQAADAQAPALNR